jgi:integrase
MGQVLSAGPLRVREINRLTRVLAGALGRRRTRKRRLATVEDEIKTVRQTLRLMQVDLAAGTVRLDPGTTKNSDGRLIIMTPELRAVLEAQQTATQALLRARGQIVPWVFHHAGSPIRNIRKTWQVACREAGLAGRIPHDFRRTAVRNLERAGVPRSVAMRMVGHNTESVYRRYAIVDEGMLRDAAARLARSGL